MSENQTVIRRFKDVKEIAQKVLGKCVVVRLDEPHAEGKMAVKLVVGYKINPLFDPNANPDDPELKPYERVIARQRSNPRSADVRIIYLRPGITVQELIENFLEPIKKSKEKAPSIATLDAKKNSKPQKSDDELALMLEKGEEVDDNSEDFDDDDDFIEPNFEEEMGEDNQAEEEEDGGEDEFEEDDDGDIIGVKPKKPKANDASALEKIAGALSTLNDNVVAISERVGKLEKDKKSAKKKK